MDCDVMLIVRDILAALTCLIFSIFFQLFNFSCTFCLFIGIIYLMEQDWHKIKQDRVKNSEL